MSLYDLEKTLLDNSPRELYYIFRNKYLKSTVLRNFNKDNPAVFVLSTGRVGTETLTALTGLCSHVFTYHEPSPQLFHLSKLAYEMYPEFLNNDPLKRTFMEALMTARREMFEYALYCHRGYIETGNHMTFLAPLVVETIPDARFIHLVRDPRDVIRSGMRRKWYNGDPYDIQRILPKPHSKIEKKWGSMSSFRKIAWLWSETNQWIMDFTQALDEKKCLLLKSEDMFKGDEITLSKLYRFINSDMPSKNKIRRVLKRKLNSQKVRDFPRYSEWDTEMLKVLIEYTGDIAGALGYKLN